jgi:hypothetical protein
VAFDRDGFSTPARLNYNKAMIYARLLFPCAKLSLKVQAKGAWLPAACGLAPDESSRRMISMRPWIE